MTKNDAAIRAIELFKDKAQLCEVGQPSKIPKGTDGTSEDSGGTSADTTQSKPTTSSSARSPTENNKTHSRTPSSLSQQPCELNTSSINA